MKDRRHHLRHVQRKVIQDVKRRARFKKEKELTKEEVEKEKVAVTSEEHLSQPRGVDRSTKYRNRSHQGYH